MKRSIKATVLGVAIFGVTVAAAAGFGLTSDNLGSGDSIVAACQTSTDINVTYSTVAYDSSLDSTESAAPGRYKVTEVTLEDVDAACVDQNVQITLSKADGESLTEVNEQTIASAGDNVYSIDSADDVLAEEVAGVHVVITGEPVAQP